MTCNAVELNMTEMLFSIVTRIVFLSLPNYTSQMVVRLTFLICLQHLSLSLASYLETLVTSDYPSALRHPTSGSMSDYLSKLITRRVRVLSFPLLAMARFTTEYRHLTHGDFHTQRKQKNTVTPSTGDTSNYGVITNPVSRCRKIVLFLISLNTTSATKATAPGMITSSSRRILILS